LLELLSGTETGKFRALGIGESDARLGLQNTATFDAIHQKEML
jgi:hypothetical protein